MPVDVDDTFAGPWRFLRAGVVDSDSVRIYAHPHLHFVS